RGHLFASIRERHSVDVCNHRQGDCETHHAISNPAWWDTGSLPPRLWLGRTCIRLTGCHSLASYTKECDDWVSGNGGESSPVVPRPRAGQAPGGSRGTRWRHYCVSGRGVSDV